MVEEKSKHRMTPINFATKKTTLIKLRDAAETEGNLTQVKHLYYHYYINKPLYR